MDQTRGAEGTATTPSGPAHRQSVLRGELWERHATMRNLNPDDAGYEAAGARVLDLTTQLLGLEVEAAADPGTVHQQRAGQVGFAVSGLLLATAVALAVASAALGAPAAAVAAGVVLPLAVLVFAVTWWIRRRGAPTTPTTPTGPADRGDPVPAPDPEPSTAPTPS